MSRGGWPLIFFQNRDGGLYRALKCLVAPSYNLAVDKLIPRSASGHSPAFSMLLCILRNCLAVSIAHSERFTLLPLCV
jgi:hypothetical protein